MWNDTEMPLAYLITFRTRGTWLHGNEKGSVNRHRNIYGTPKIPGNKGWEEYSRKKMKGEPVILSKAQRSVVEDAIKATCRFRGWNCNAVNARTNHVHSVIASGDAGAGNVLQALKGMRPAN